MNPRPTVVGASGRRPPKWGFPSDSPAAAATDERLSTTVRMPIHLRTVTHLTVLRS